MKRRTHIQLTPYEDLFSTEEQRQDYHREKVMDIPLDELHSFRDHPFKVLDDDRMADTTRSIRSVACWCQPLPAPVLTGAMS